MLQKICYFMPLSDTSKSKCNFIVLYSGPHISTVAFRQPKCKSFRSFLPINVKINLSSGIRLKRKICFISIFSFRVLELFQSNAWKPNLLSHLTSVFVVHLSVLVVSDLWDDCNRKNIQFFFLFFLHYDSTSFSSQGYDYSSWGIGPKFQHFKCLTHRYFCHLRNLRVPIFANILYIPWVIIWGEES